MAMTMSTDQAIALEKKQRAIDREPFRDFRIDDVSVLHTVKGREICEKCYKSRKFFCYTCCSPVIDQKYFPRVKLPIKIDIIKHVREIEGKSTAIHAAILAPEDVTIYTYPDFPMFSDNERVVLIFPSATAMPVEQLFTSEWQSRELKCNLKNRFPITRALFIDSTWHQTKSIYKDRKLRELPCVILKSRISQFWRHQKKSPRWYLATIEAIHHFLTELHECAFKNCIASDLNDADSDEQEASTPIESYSGEYDNLLYFFKYMYEKIHTIYDHEKLWAYKRPLI